MMQIGPDSCVAIVRENERLRAENALLRATNQSLVETLQEET